MCKLLLCKHIHNHKRRRCWFFHHKCTMRHLIKLRVSQKTLDKKIWSECTNMGIGAAKRYRITITTPESTSPDVIEAGFKLLHCTLTVYNRTFWGKIVYANNFTLAASCSKIGGSKNNDVSAEGGPKGGKTPKRKNAEVVEETVCHSAILCGASWSVIMVPPENSPPESSANLRARLASEGSIFEKVRLDEQEKNGDTKTVFEGDMESGEDEADDMLIQTADIADDPYADREGSGRNCDSQAEKQQGLYTTTWEVDVYSEYVFDCTKHVEMEVVLTASYQLAYRDKVSDELVEGLISSLCNIEQVPIRNSTPLPTHLKSSVLDLSMSQEKWYSALRMGNSDQTNPTEMAVGTEKENLQVDGDKKGASPFFGHLVVITHGIYGSFLDMLYIKDEIERRYTLVGEKVYVLAIDGNQGATKDGVDAGGSRIADCILGYVGWDSYGESSTNDAITDGNTDNDDSCNKAERPPNIRPVGRISFIGHSLGGIYNRYAIGLLESVGFFEHFAPAHFISLAAPHLGIGDGWRVLHFLLSQGIIGRTGRDLTLQPSGRPPVQRGSSLEGEGEIETVTKLEKSVRESEETVETLETKMEERKIDEKEEENPLPNAVPATSKIFSFLGRFRANDTSGDAPNSSTNATPTITDEDEPQSNENHGLLYATTEPNSVFMLGLAKFKTRTVYSNVINDLAVGYYTGMILHSSFDREAYVSRICAPAAAALNLTIIPAQTSDRGKITAIEAASQGAEDPESEAVPVAGETDDIRIPYYRCATEKENRGVMEAGLIKTNAPRPIIHDEIITPESFAARTKALVLSGDRISAPGSTRYPRDPLYSQQRALKGKVDICQTMSDRLNSSFPWRKVAVHLDWDAHVNMCVRRRHLNRRGWAVIEHILTEHVFWSDPE